MRSTSWIAAGMIGALVAGSSTLAAAPSVELLVDAVKNGDRPATRALLQKATDVNVPSADGTTPLHWAVHRNEAELVDTLIRAGANVKATNRFGVFPLSLAAQNGSAPIIERLIAAGADVASTLPGGETVLMTASRTGNVPAMQALLAHGADANAKNPRGQTALMWAAAKDNADAIKVLLGRGADLSARTANKVTEVASTAPFDLPPPTGFTALLFAVRAGSLDATRALLDGGANVNDTLSDGESALVLALANTHWGVADLLLDRGANPNLAGAGWNALHQAVRWRRPNPNGGYVAPIPTGSLDSIQVIKKIIARGVDVNARMTKNGMKDGQRNRLIRTGATAFFLAAKNADVEAMKVLLAAGADATIPSLENSTPLMVAAGVHIYHPGEDGGSLLSDQGEVLEAVKLCVEHGNDVNAVDNSGYTALHGVAFRGVNSVVEYLVEKGAKLDARTYAFDWEREDFLPDGKDRGWTPLAIANGFSYSDFFSGQPQTADLLRKLMKERNIPTDEQVIDPRVCLDCVVTHAKSRTAHAEREKKLDALAAVQLAQP